MRRTLIPLVALCMISACGQKGPLYFRDNPPAGVKRERPAVPKPVPYPAQTDAPAAAGSAKE